MKNPTTQIMIRGEDFRELECWKTARSVVCTLLDAAATLSRNTRHAGFARSLRTLSIAALDALARGYEGDARSFMEARSVVGRLEQLISQGRDRGALKASDFSSVQARLNLVMHLLEYPSF